MTLKYFSNVTEGKFQKNVSQLIASELRHFEGKRVQLTIEKLKSSRSAEQNRLWWMYITILSKELGYSKDEIHEIAKFKFLKCEKVNERTGEIFEYLGSTAKLSKSEFADLVTELQQWAAQTFSIVLPSPNQQISADL